MDYLLLAPIVSYHSKLRRFAANVLLSEIGQGLSLGLFMTFPPHCRRYRAAGDDRIILQNSQNVLHGVHIPSISDFYDGFRGSCGVEPQAKDLQSFYVKLL